MLQQLSYRVVVHESGSENGPAVWDSQHISDSYNVKYSGPALRSGAKYSWSVEVRVSGEPTNNVGGSRQVRTATSLKAVFSMGMLKQDDWTAKFVALGKSGGHPQCPWFRKKFSVSEPEMTALRAGASAQLMVASVGYCEATVNGKAVTEGVLLPSISYLPKRVMYRTYDVSHLLASGDNAIGLWASAGWAEYPDLSHFRSAPLVMAELHIDGAVKVVTDASWKVRGSTISNVGYYGGGGFGGDSLDDSKAVDGWDLAPLDDSGWSSATVINVTNVSISADVMEPTVKYNSYPAVSVTTANGNSSANSTHVVEMSELYTGWFEVR
jgi:alpha-L-rhamnosidase